MADILLVKSGGEKAVPEWQALFGKMLPHLEVRAWEDPEVDANAVTYALVWEPHHGRLKNYPNLKVIFSSAAGVDHITCDPELPRHLPIVRMTAEETAQTMGEYVCLHALALLRDYERMRAAQAARLWDEFNPPRTALTTRVGILGLGTIGERCARMLTGLGFPVQGWTRTPKQVAGIGCLAGPEGLQALLASSDILVGLVPDTPETRGLVCAKTLAQLPQGAALINVARGPLVVMDDLIAALDSGHLSHAVLDVFETEPLPENHPAWAHPRITVTSHLAGYATRRARAQKVADAIKAFEAGGPLPSVYDPQRGY